jgi:hypothetical protein
MFDVFYFGPKPNLFEFEQPAESLNEAMKLSRTRYCFYLYGGNDYTNFNFNVVPTPWMDNYVHVWPSQWQQDGGVYLASKRLTNIEYHFCNDQFVVRKSSILHFSNTQHMEFDYSWHPNPHEPDYEYHFPTQHQSAGGPVYNGTSGVKLCDEQVAKALPYNDNWTIPEDMYIDTSWHPNILDPEYTYHFPTKWQSAGGVTYGTGNNIKIADFISEQYESKDGWTVPDDVDAKTIDFTWKPNVLDPPYIYHFPIGEIQSSGLMYTVEGATEVKLMDYFPGHDIGTFKELEVFYVDKNNRFADARYKNLLVKYPTMQKIRYANSMLQTVRRCVSRSKSNRFWVISSENIYEDFDFDWRPESWQSYMTHVFGSQWQKWSDTYLVNKLEFQRSSKWANSLTEFPNLNFVQDQTVVVPDDLHAIVYVDWGNKESQPQLERLKLQHNNITVTRFVDNYLDTFKRIINNHTGHEYIWIINSICDYSKFDFSWQPEPWQNEMIHVFPSGGQKRGDTFYIHVESFKTQMHDLEILDWFNVINYTVEQDIERFPMPVIIYNDDTIIDTINNYEWPNVPYATFRLGSYNTVNPNDRTLEYTKSLYGSPCLWRPKDREVISLTVDNSYAIVPRDINKQKIKQVYDFPYINKKVQDLVAITPLDICFISNGEPEADKWYSHLLDVAITKSPTSALEHKNVIHHIEGIDGRVKAYQAAALASNTDWFFAVFAKIEVEQDFDFTWQPDYFQQAKHYIFNARNPVNGLEYGHMGIIAYNKRLTLATNNPGLDFTLSAPHEVVPVLSGTAHYNTDPWMTWRTAFREVLKLKQFDTINPSVENESRLRTWITQGKHKLNGVYSIRGASDALRYYEEVNGDPVELQKSFDWAWLKEKFESN